MPNWMCLPPYSPRKRRFMVPLWCRTQLLSAPALRCSAACVRHSISWRRRPPPRARHFGISDATMLRLALLSLCGAAAARTTWRDLEARQYAYSFKDYVAEFDKNYTAAEAAVAEPIFLAELAKIRAHNSKPGSTYKMGLNQHSANTAAEWKALRGYNAAAAFSSMVPDAAAATSSRLGDLPNSVDWRKKGVVSKVKNQGGCGSCWAFSTTETVESMVAIATGKLLTLAPQELVDCAPNPQQCGGTGGCSGSTQELGFNYSAGAGFASEDSYPYTARDGACQMGKSAEVVAHIKGYTKLKSNDYHALMDAVANQGPISISLDASFGSCDGGHCVPHLEPGEVGSARLAPARLAQGAWGARVSGTRAASTTARAAPPSTTRSSWSATAPTPARTTGWSGTRGERAGASLGTSGSSGLARARSRVALTRARPRARGARAVRPPSRSAASAASSSTRPTRPARRC